MTTVQLTYPLEWDGGVVAQVEIEVDLTSDCHDPDDWVFGEIRADMVCGGRPALVAVNPHAIEHREIIHWITHDSAARMLCDDAWRHREPAHREYEAVA